MNSGFFFHRLEDIIGKNKIIKIFIKITKNNEPITVLVLGSDKRDRSYIDMSTDEK